MTFYKRVIKHVNIQFALLVLILIAINIPYFMPDFNFMPVHDTMGSVGIFSFIYNEYLLHNEIPLWMPYNLFGSPIDYYLLITMSPALYFTAFIGKLFGLTDALLLFKSALFLEQLALLIGTYFLSRRLFSHRATISFVCIGSTVISSFWGIQIYWNFRLYYLVPLTLFFIMRFHDTNDFRHLFSAGFITALSLIGNLIYYLPLFMFFYFVFVFMLFFSKANLAIDVRGLFKPHSALLCSFFLVTFIIITAFTLNAFHYTLIYSPGRDPTTGKVSLWNFLTYYGGIQPGTGLGTLPEIIYAVPACNEVTFYIGLIPLIFFLYALKTSYNDNIFKAFFVITALVFFLSVPLLSFVATFLYYTFPLFNHFRHLFLARQLIKPLLLILSGFGLDRYLSSSHNASQRFSIIWIGLGLAVAIISLDIFAFRGKIPYTQIFYSQYSYYFHCFDLCVLLTFLYVLYGKIKSKTNNMHLIMTIFFLFEIMSYNHFLFFLSPIRLPEVTKQKYEVAREYSWKIDFVKSLFKGKKYEFHNKRTSPEETTLLIGRTAPLITKYYGEKFTTNYSSIYIDPCFPEYRADYVSLGLDRFIRARLGIPLDVPLAGEAPKLNDMADDRPFARALGCNTPKLFLTCDVSIANSLDEAANIIRQSQTIDISPVIFHNTFENLQLPFQKPACSESPGRIHVIHFSANSLNVTADISSPTGAWLIYLDNYHPGWRATVNGQPRKIATANLAFKAVKLDSGHQDIEFTFSGNGLNRVYIGFFSFLGVFSTTFLLGWAIWLTTLGTFGATQKQSSPK